MAQIDAFQGAAVLVKISLDGGTTFTHPCSINTTRGITLNTETSSTVLPDCTDPTAPGWSTTRITGLSATVDGAGVAEKGDIKPYADAVVAGVAVQCVVEVGGSGGTSFTGEFAITSWGITGSRLEDVTFDITLQSNGEVVVAAIP